jgi:hypothetical protein
MGGSYGSIINTGHGNVKAKLRGSIWEDKRDLTVQASANL